MHPFYLLVLLEVFLGVQLPFVTNKGIQGMIKYNAFNSIFFNDFLVSVQVCNKKGYLKFKNLAVHNFPMNVLGFASMEFGFLHWHGVPACQQIPPPCLLGHTFFNEHNEVVVCNSKAKDFGDIIEACVFKIFVQQSKLNLSIQHRVGGAI